MKFFVTGATGFLGRKISNMLVGVGHSAIFTKRSTSHIGCLADNDSVTFVNISDNNSRSLALSEGLQERDFIYIDDVISAYKVVVDNINDFTDSFTEIGVGANNLISIRELVLLVKKLINHTKTKLDFGAIPRRDGEMQPDCEISFLGKLGGTPKYSLQDGIAESIWQSR